MTPERWQEVKKILADVLDREPSARSDFLDKACPEPAMRREVESLIAAHDAGGIPSTMNEAAQTGKLKSGTQLGPYEILAPLGAGGMGEVYRARDTRLDRAVAVKLLSTELSSDAHATERFHRESRAASALNHPNICTIHDIGEHQGHPFIVMELLEGRTLQDCILHRPLPTGQVLAYGGQAAEALEAAHSKGIIHRDIKPANLFVTNRGHVKVLDFGLAQQQVASVRDATLTGILTAPQAVVGTLPYMAPEQLRGDTADARTDIYALGVVLYEMATGRRPFDASVPTALAADIQHKSPPVPARLNPDIPQRLEDIILKCLEKDPANRYQSAKELAVDLRRLAIPSASSQVAGIQAGLSSRRRIPAPAYAAAGLVVLALILFGLNVGGMRKRLFGGAGSGEIRSMAVLPLENLSHDPEQDYFAEGMTEALITNLAQVGALRVTSRTSVMQYKGTKKSLPEIARELNVDAVIEGSVQRSGERVAINVQLIQASTDQHLWARSYERDLKDVLDLQREVARSIAGEIRVVLTPQEKQKLTATRSVNPEAYQAYLKGRYYWNQRSETSIKRGREYFEQAIEKDPTYAPAFSGLADVADALSWYGYESPQSFVLARQLALKAIALDDSLAEGHASLAMGLFFADWERAGAEREFLRAIELDPRYANAHHWYAEFLEATGRQQEAIAEAKRALELEPVSLIVNTWVARRYYFARQSDAAFIQCRKALELNGDFAPARYQMGLIDIERKDYDGAIAEFQKAKELSGGATIYVAALARGYAAAGRRAEALKIYEQLKRPGEKYVSPYWMAQISSTLGLKKEALEWLEASWAGRAVWMVILSVDPALDPLRGESGFHDFVQRTSLLQ